MQPSVKGIVKLKPGRERSSGMRHPWIFSGAVAERPDCGDGEIVEVHSDRGEFLGIGLWNSRTSIALRMFAFSRVDIASHLRALLEKAVALRRTLVQDEQTTCFRLINAEGDGIPGLVVDCYGNNLVLQVGTTGIELIKPFLVDQLRDLMAPQSIFEKSTAPSRLEEGLSDREELLWGEPVEAVVVNESGIKFKVDICGGQKTGFFLDQREMRRQIRDLSRGRSVLNCFCYTGGFSMYALAGGARAVTSIDVSEPALAICAENTMLNQFDQSRHSIISRDVLEFLSRSNEEYELIVLDPPAFAKRRDHLARAVRGYGEINYRGFKSLTKGGILLTCSCSYHLDSASFEDVVAKAALRAGRNVRILGRHRQAPDHPTGLFHPEGAYLKSLLLEVS